MDQRSSNAEQRRGGNLSPLSLLGAFLFLFLLTPPLLLLQWRGCGCLLVCVAASPLSGTVWHPTLASLSLASMEPASHGFPAPAAPVARSPARVPERAARGARASVSPLTGQFPGLEEGLWPRRRLPRCVT
jgi:hypothetical protein